MDERENIQSGPTSPTIAFAPDSSDRPAAAATDTAGTVIAGKYKLLEPIGEGGMGSVWMAQQFEPVKRLVAVKLIKLGMDSQAVLARFDAERQALALMDHPNIAKVLDGGMTLSGRPFFVMELVRGIPITQFCDERKLTPQERLELFIPVCHALQHAHQKGVIHRDIKPSNVLVALYDDHPTPKVIDFGMAKATGMTLTDKTLVTGFGTVVGTPQYMSPEQATLNNLDIDTRSDVYSLGALLYELLTGELPLTPKDLATAGLLEVLRVVREDEPPRPSARLSSSATLPALAARRNMEPGKLTALMQSDLDWIVMKALEKERTRRYETASELAMDLHRYLTGEPVQAHPPSAGYRLRKLLRKHRRPALAAALLFLALLGGAIGTTIGMIRAERSRQTAQKRLQQIEKGMDILNSVFLDLNPLSEEKEGKPLLELLGDRLTSAAQQLEGDAIGDPEMVADLQYSLGNSLLRLGRYEQAEHILAKALGAREASLGTDHPDVLRTRMLIAEAFSAEGKLPEAIALLEQVWNTQIKKLGADHSDTLLTLDKLAMAYGHAGNVAESVRLQEQTRDVLVKNLGPNHLSTLVTINNLGVAYRNAGRYSDAIRVLEQARDGLEQKLGIDNPNMLSNQSALAAAYKASGNTSEAVRILEKVQEARIRKLGASDPVTLSISSYLAYTYCSIGKTSEAIPLLEQIRNAQISRFGMKHPETLNTLSYLAHAYAVAEKYTEAILIGEQARDAMAATLGIDHPVTLNTLSSLAGAYRAVKRYPEAIRLGEQVLIMAEKKVGADHPDTLQKQSNLGEIYFFAGKTDEAIRLYEPLWVLQAKKLGADHPDTLATLFHLACSYYNAGKKQEAIPLFEQLRDLRIKKLGPDHSDMIYTLDMLGTAYRDTGRYSEAIPLWEQVRDAQVKELGAGHPDVLRTLASLGYACQMSGKQAQALATYRQAAESLEKLDFKREYSAHFIMSNFALCLQQMKQHPEAELWRRKYLIAVKQQQGSQSLAYAQELEALGHNLIGQKKWVEAESVFRECLAVRTEQAQQNADKLTTGAIAVLSWKIAFIKASLGEAFTGQKKFAEAEPLLLAAYEEMKPMQQSMPASIKGYLTLVVMNLRNLYTAWDKPDKAAEWKAKLPN